MQSQAALWYSRYNAEHTETEEAAVTLIITPPTETENGELNYQTESFLNEAFSVQNKKIVLPALQSISTLRLPSGLETVEAEAFAGLAVEAVIIPDGCKTIGSRAFADCPNLIYVRVPASVTEIAEDAFDGCPNVVIDRTAE